MSRMRRAGDGLNILYGSGIEKAVLQVAFLFDGLFVGPRSSRLPNSYIPDQPLELHESFRSHSALRGSSRRDGSYSKHSVAWCVLPLDVSRHYSQGMKSEL